MKTSDTQYETTMSSRRRFVSLCWALVLFVGFCGSAQGAFTGDYDLSNFTLTNVNADGFAILNGSGSLVLTGGNNGSGLPGFTDFTIASRAAGMVSFNYEYTSADDPTYDLAGYLNSGSLIFLADAPATGSVSFFAGVNQVFGFRIGTEDNTHEPGVLIISDFIAPAAASDGVPEPSTFSLFAVGVVFAAIRRRRCRRPNQNRMVAA